MSCCLGYHGCGTVHVNYLNTGRPQKCIHSLTCDPELDEKLALETPQTQEFVYISLARSVFKNLLFVFFYHHEFGGFCIVLLHMIYDSSVS